MFGSNKGGIFSNLQPKTSFILGVILSFLAICTIGFFILLATVLGNDKADNQIADKNDNINQQADVRQEDTNPSVGAKNLKPITDQDHVRGSKDAPIKLVEFSDFQCPYCGKVHPTLQQLVDDYSGKVTWVYKHFPVISPDSRKVSEASECAAEQGKFWEYTDGLYANQSLINQDYLSQLASEIGLNQDKFDKCLSSGKYASKVAEHEQEARSVGVTGTPGIYVNDVLIKGAVPIEQFRQVIDSMLN